MLDRLTLAQVIRLASRDFLKEWRMSACFVLALAAVLTPLLVLFALKFGLIDTLRQRLVEDPRNREIRPLASARFDDAWFADLAARPETGFLVPRTRQIAATITLRVPGSRSRFVTAELVPSAAGDPLLPAGTEPPAGVEVVLLSAPAAQRLGLAAGDSVEGLVQRVVAGRRQPAKLTARIGAVLPERAFTRPAAFVSLPLISAVEDYRDGRAVAALGWAGEAAPPGARVYAGFRLYARGLDDVVALRDLMRARGIEVYTRAAEIETVQQLDANLGNIFWIIAGIGLGGFLLSLGANLWAHVDRKRRDLGVLRLLGLPTAAITLFPVLQASFTAVLGGALSGMVYLGVAGLINRLFASSLDKGELACRLLSGHFAAGLVLTVACAVAASALAGYRASQIEPAEGTRNV
ncbi:MAG: FtsX-like permease family protein [Hyphomicrobiales bacterium]|nr:FtsX-like permease family protein [Hyphomicrobiales bacterium]